MARRATNSPATTVAGAGREPLPSLTPVFLMTGLFVVILVGNLAGFVIAGHIYNLAIFLLLTPWYGHCARKSYQTLIARRREVRERNLDRVENWIINSSLPDPSPELWAREKAWEMMDTGQPLSTRPRARIGP